MADKKNQKPAAQATETTVDNIMDQIRNKNLQTETAVAAAVKKIEEQEEESKREDAIRAIKKFQYKNARALIELRKRRAEEKATKEHLAASKEILDQYLEGKLTRVEADKKSEEIEETKRKAFSEVEKEFRNNVQELRDAYPGYYYSDWDCRW